ncbi:MAG TPA: ABC transporter permease [Candidatus Angelobacter sp.]|nr:ABC transporter permease [Candidatus Angelobacter sp.]
MWFEHWVYTIPMRVRSLIHRNRLDTELDEELRDHIDRQVEDNLAHGMNPEQARLAALRAFGNPVALAEQTHDMWSWSGIELLLNDVRLGTRGLVRTPGFASIAILVMALGIGANVALFAIVRAVLINPLPYADSSRLVRLYEKDSIGGLNIAYGASAGGMYSEWKKQNHTFADMAIEGSTDYNLSSGGEQLSEVVRGGNFSWNMLPLLGVQPALGRGFTADDDKPSANPTVLLSWGLWKRRFGGDPAIVNKTISLDAVPHTVIGIMPYSFSFSGPRFSTAQLWTPIYQDKRPALMKMLDEHEFRAIGRLKPGVTEAQAIADLTLITRRIHDQHLDQPFTALAANARPFLDSIVGRMKTPLYALLAATCCVLLIVCLNVANLLVARAAARRREMAIRAALGGSKLRLLRQHLIETLLICAAGGAIGIFFAAGVLHWFASARPDVPRADSISIDDVAAAFTFGLVILCATFAGAISSLSIRRDQILQVLRESSRSQSAGVARTRLRSVLLSLEVGLTVVLLIGAGLLLKSYAQLRSTDLGCLTDNVLKMELSLPNASYKDPTAVTNFFSLLLGRMRNLPGIRAAGIIAPAVPGDGEASNDNFTILEHPPLPLGKADIANNRWCDAGYFAALGIPLLEGRTFGNNQVAGHSTEIIVSESFARQFFPGENPIGKHMTTFNQKGSEIVGVVGDTRTDPGEPAHPMMYFPILAVTGDYMHSASFVVRSDSDVMQFALPVERLLASMDNNLAFSGILTMGQVLDRNTLEASFDARLLLVFAGLSLLLAAVGLFGVLSYLVAQRTMEIGIRMALGAGRAHVLRLTLTDGLRPALFGLLLGLAASAGTVKLIESMLFGTRPFDLMVFLTVSATLLAVAALACLVPAWRASRLDPMQALRME